MTVTSGSGVNNLLVLMGAGNGSFTQSTNVQAVGSGGPIAADVNADGRTDVVTWDHVAGTISVLLSTGTGTFSVLKNSPFSAPTVNNVAVADLNGDGYPDFAAGLGNNMNVVRVYMSTAVNAYAASVDYPVGGDATYLATGDLTGDNIPDIAASLAGGPVAVLAGKSGGTFQPVQLFVGFDNNDGEVIVTDLNHDGRADLLLGGGSGAGAMLNLGCR
jgi:hypothetical protein